MKGFHKNILRYTKTKKIYHKQKLTFWELLEEVSKDRNIVSYK